MAKSKRKTPRARSRGTTTVVRRRRAASPVRRRRRSSGSVGWIPPKEDLFDMAGAGAYGYLEKQAAADTAGGHFLYKIPKPIDAVGFTGNVGIAAWVVYKLTKNKIARHFAKGTLDVAAYKLFRRGKAYTEGSEGLDLSGEDEGDFVDMEGLDVEIGDDECDD